MRLQFGIVGGEGPFTFAYQIRCNTRSFGFTKIDRNSCLHGLHCQWSDDHINWSCHGLACSTTCVAPLTVLTGHAEGLTALTWLMIIDFPSVTREKMHVLFVICNEHQQELLGFLLFVFSQGVSQICAERDIHLRPGRQTRSTGKGTPFLPPPFPLFRSRSQAPDIYGAPIASHPK